jgi:hypothetical protein
MTEYRPIARLADCGNGYGIARVADEEGHEQEVRVDLNADDGTADPQIVIPESLLQEESSVVVDDAFVTAYRELTVSDELDAAGQTRVCGYAPEGDSLLIGGTPLVLDVLSLVFDVLALDSSLRQPGFSRGLFDEPLTTGLFVARQAMGVASSAIYPIMQHQLDEGWAGVFDGFHAAGGLAAFIAALAVESREDAYMHTAVRLWSDVLLARVTRHFGEDWGAAAQTVLGGALLLVGLFACSAGEAPAEDLSAPPPGMRDPSPTSGVTPFSNICTNVGSIGASHAGVGFVRSLFSFGRWLGRELSSGGEGAAELPSVSISLEPGSGGRPSGVRLGVGFVY